MDEQAIVAQISHLVPGARSASPARAGGNNRVYKVWDADNAVAVKFYPSIGMDRTDRMRREFEGLDFLVRHGLRDVVPTPISRDEQAGAAAFSWLDGTPVAAFDERDIGTALGFLRALHNNRKSPDAVSLPSAREAVLSLAGLVQQIETRLTALEAVRDGHPELAFFLDQAQVVFDYGRLRAEDIYRRYREPIDAPLPQDRTTLSPSDFGAHNAVRLPSSGLGFLDFEYFGWDDPVKLVSDTLWHPATNLRRNETLARLFRDGAGEIYGGDPAYRLRLDAQLPLYGIRWICIVLNEFLPERLVHRRRAGATEPDEAIRSRQLAKAMSLLADTKLTLP
jgi:Phosphotransferase enzyme family